MRPDNELYEDVMVLFTGDFVNKGPFSLRVIDWIMNQTAHGKAYTVVSRAIHRGRVGKGSVGCSESTLYKT